jgi:hypothetical protein
MSFIQNSDIGDFICVKFHKPIIAFLWNEVFAVQVFI